MSDLSLQFQQAASQLPVHSYFDAELFEREKELLFKAGPRYVGHKLAVPNPGDYFALPQEGQGRALVRGAQGEVRLLSNICRHRQAIMLNGRGSLHAEGKGHAGGSVVCPLHRWTYSDQGQLLGAPHFRHDPCLDLNGYKLREWNGMLFEDNGRDIAADLAGMTEAASFSFEGYALDHVELHECNYNWKTFIEVYLEDYHVAPFHPGLGNFVTCDDLRWQLRKQYSVQTVGVAPTFGEPGSDIYKKWKEVLLAYQNGQKPTHGAIWLTYYPHITVEWYPHVLVISTMHPVSINKTLNMVEFYYPEEIVSFEREFVQAQR
ncbi:MAG: aromatic ring-hydroxylating dioxygenase subunit alpha, partial [Burkholderiaceae bacterium]|nr:aromatic ring-hydroxylating dioxygenase subunit alpha [Burkholderiaceae bacterium]